MDEAGKVKKELMEMNQDKIREIQKYVMLAWHAGEKNLAMVQAAELPDRERIQLAQTIEGIISK